MIRYWLPSVGREVKLDRNCPHCGRRNGRIHTGVRLRAIRDVKVGVVHQRRMRCPWCGTTWTVRADGVGQGRQRSDRVRGLAVMLYMFGLSYRSASAILATLECRSSKSSIERDVAEAGQKARSLHEQAPRMQVRVLGVDGTGAAMAGVSAGMLFFVDVERHQLVSVEPIHEKETAKVRRHVARVMRQMGSEQLRTDELSVYDHIVPEDRHRICLAHWRKSKGKRAVDLYRQAVREDRPLDAESMRQLLTLLRQTPRPSVPPPELRRLVRRYINCRHGSLWKINQLLQHIERTWEHVSDDPVDPTNNATERLIGLTFKIRAKTMRGFKAKSKVTNHIYLAHFLRGQAGQCDLKNVI